MPRRDPQIPPRSASTVNLNAAATNLNATAPVTEDLPVPDISGIDLDVLFRCNSEYITIERHLEHLKLQLEQTYEDIEKLKELKSEALADPESFINFLREKDSKEEFPKLQEIMTIPDIDINRYKVKLTRRANTRFEQNLEYLSARVNEVQMRLPTLKSPVSSDSIPVSRGFNGKASMKRSFNDIREEFLSVLENNPSALKLRDVDLYINPYPPMNEVSSSVSPAAVHQPKPRQTPRFNHSQVDFVEFPTFDSQKSQSQPNSRPSSVPPAPITPVSIASASNPATPPANPSIKIRIRKPSSVAPENTSLTHNIPWSDDEKRKLEYLMTVFPEEDIQARRYAKIAAALGTRTANQVASRVQKVALKEQKYRERIVKELSSSSSPIDVSGDDTAALVAELEAFFAQSNDPKVKETPEYAEYLRLKKQLEAIAKDPINGVLHVGYKCDCCGIEPIIGARWTCCSCPKDAPPIDLCSGCVSKKFETNSHKVSHVMKKIDFYSDDAGDANNPE